MTDLDRFAIGEEEFVAYDRENHLAWIQTADAVALDVRI
jgi:hypothetical protein